MVLSFQGLERTKGFSPRAFTAALETDDSKLVTLPLGEACEIDSSSPDGNRILSLLNKYRAGELKIKKKPYLFHFLTRKIYL